MARVERPVRPVRRTGHRFRRVSNSERRRGSTWSAGCCAKDWGSRAGGDDPVGQGWAPFSTRPPPPAVDVFYLSSGVGHEWLTGRFFDDGKARR